MYSSLQRPVLMDHSKSKPRARACSTRLYVYLIHTCLIMRITLTLFSKMMKMTRRKTKRRKST